MKLQQSGLAVITGCDSGLGKILCERFLSQGYAVAASYLGRLPATTHPMHFPLPLDLRDIASVEQFISGVLALHSRFGISILMNNAGVVLSAPVEDMPLEGYREVFEINFFGTVRITQALLPAVIEGKGRIVINGSLAGRIALPYFSPYVASKFALEGFADSLRREMIPFGVKVILLELGAVSTPIWLESWKKIEERCLPFVGDRYRKVFLRAAEKFVREGNEGMDAVKASKKVFDAMTCPSPKTRYIISEQRIVKKIAALLPDFILDRILVRTFRLEKP